MNFKKLQNKPWFKIISNKYVLISLIFTGWMFFLDTNSWFIHHELNEEINELQDNRIYYKTEISKDQEILQNLNDSVELEKFARQQYYMKRANEDIYIIEYDSIN